MISQEWLCPFPVGSVPSSRNSLNTSLSHHIPRQTGINWSKPVPEHGQEPAWIGMGIPRQQSELREGRVGDDQEMNEGAARGPSAPKPGQVTRLEAGTMDSVSLSAELRLWSPQSPFFHVPAAFLRFASSPRSAGIGDIPRALPSSKQNRAGKSRAKALSPPSADGWERSREPRQLLPGSSSQPFPAPGAPAEPEIKLGTGRGSGRTRGTSSGIKHPRENSV